jgi:site-specific recombinase XerD
MANLSRSSSSSGGSFVRKLTISSKKSDHATLSLLASALALLSSGLSLRCLWAEASTALAEADVDLPVLQALMGHDHVDSSAAYIHLAPAHVRAAYDAARDRQRAWQAGR